MKALRVYAFSLMLIAATAAGALMGRVAPQAANAIRPLGDLFLNLISTVLVPLVFFTVSSGDASDARQPSRRRGCRHWQ